MNLIILEKIFRIGISGLFFFAAFSPFIFQDQWITYVKQSQQHAESLLEMTIMLLVAIALTVAILQIIPVIPNKWFNKQHKPGVE